MVDYAHFIDDPVPSESMVGKNAMARKTYETMQDAMRRLSKREQDPAKQAGLRNYYGELLSVYANEAMPAAERQWTEGGEKEALFRLQQRPDLRNRDAMFENEHVRYVSVNAGQIFTQLQAKQFAKMSQEDPRQQAWNALSAELRQPWPQAIMKKFWNRDEAIDGGSFASGIQWSGLLGAGGAIAAVLGFFKPEGLGLLLAVPLAAIVGAYGGRMVTDYFSTPAKPSTPGTATTPSPGTSPATGRGATPSAPAPSPPEPAPPPSPELERPVPARTPMGAVARPSGRQIG